MATTPSRRLRRGAAALAVLSTALGLATAIAPPAQAADPTQPVPGVVITTTPEDPGQGTAGRIAFTMTTARTLTITCSTAGRIVANGTSLAARCTDVRGGVSVTGTAHADKVTIEGKDLGTSEAGGYQLRLGTGNDTAVVRHGTGSAYLYGEGGNDRLSAGLYAAQWHLPEWSRDVLDGGNGDDTLQNLGYLTPPGEVDQGQESFEGTTFIGGPGADRVWGDAARWDHVQADLADALTLSGGPGTVELSTTWSPDTVKVRNNGNHGTLLTVTTGTTTKNYTFPTAMSALRILAKGGNDTVTVEHRSKGTTVFVDGEAGTDKLSIRPSVAFTWDKPNGVVRQPGWADITYARATTETVTVTRL